MKKARDDKKIQTIPKGVYEGGEINQELRENKNNKFINRAMDAQENGYKPSESSEK